ncbi:MAG: 2-octaprenyl-6-methoxyphenyl hydroxylase [Halioglobus sp.]
MNEHADVVIAGGGMVGVSLALQLGALLPQERRIVLVEGFPFPKPTEDGVAQYHPSFDARSTALSISSRLVYEELGVWSDLERWLCPIETIHVSNRGRFGSTLMSAPDYGWPALGYVVENAWLGNTLIQALYRQNRVEVISPAKVVAAHPGSEGVTVSLQGAAIDCIKTDLLLVADGANSGLREQLGVAVAEKSYRQHALIANVAFAEPHKGCAYERFTDQGPIALLPLSGTTDEEHRAGLVWTLPAEQAEQLRGAPPEEFLSALQQSFGYRLGRFVQVGERHCYPLSLVQSAEQVRQGVVIMGNAAHALHPVAGQGYNLALRDAAVLTRILADAAAEGRSLGDLTVLQQYYNQQKVDQMRTVSFSDKLPALFMQSDPVLGLARDMALAGLDLLPGVKREFVRHAAGVAAINESGHA